MNRFCVIVMFCLFSLFKLAGCQCDTIECPEPDRQIVVYFTVDSLSGSLLKSAATSDEITINKIILFGVDNQSNVTKLFDNSKPSSGGISLTISRTIRTLYAIANPSASLAASLEAETTKPSIVSDLTNLTGDFSSKPESPFLMSGKADVSSASNVSIELVRVVAKINIVGNNGFQIKSVTVKNIPKEGYVFKREPITVPSVGKVTHTYTYTESSDFLVYVPESSKSDPVQLVVSGQFQNNPVSYTVDYLKKDGNPVDLVRNTCYEVGITPTLSNPYKNGIKILAIGNSYSQNALHYMFDLLTQLGVNGSNIILANAYISGGSLNDHFTNAKNNTKAELKRETFLANGKITETSKGAYTLQELIEQQPWDVITLQQASNYSGVSSTYNTDLDFLIQYIADHASNPNYKLGWHMTWAYRSGYSSSWPQLFMYHEICNAVETKIVPNNAFDFIIPTGTAIQNARGLYGDILNDDGTHLSNLGRYIAAAMWIKTITGYDIASLKTPYTASDTYYYNAIPYTINAGDLTKIVQSVNAAYASPFVSP